MRPISDWYWQRGARAEKTSGPRQCRIGGCFFSNFCGNDLRLPIDGSCDYTNIQEAINAAIDGDVIEIAAGTYAPLATIDTNGKAVTVRGVAGKGKDDAPATGCGTLSTATRR
jgi:hypothetical protein